MFIHYNQMYGSNKRERERESKLNSSILITLWVAPDKGFGKYSKVQYGHK